MSQTMEVQKTAEDMIPPNCHGANFYDVDAPQ